MTTQQTSESSLSPVTSVDSGSTLTFQRPCQILPVSSVPSTVCHHIPPGTATLPLGNIFCRDMNTVPCSLLLTPSHAQTSPYHFHNGPHSSNGILNNQNNVSHDKLQLNSTQTLCSRHSQHLSNSDAFLLNCGSVIPPTTVSVLNNTSLPSVPAVSHHVESSLVPRCSNLQISEGCSGGLLQHTSSIRTAENLRTRVFELEKSSQMEYERYKKEVTNHKKIMEKWKIKCEELAKRIKEEKEKTKGLEAYLATLPTAEETSKLKNTMLKLESENKLMKLKMEEMEKSLKVCRSDFMNRELYVSSVEQRSSELRAQLKFSEERIATLERTSKDATPSDEESIKLSYVDLEDFQKELDTVKQLLIIKESHQKQSEKHQEKLIQEYEVRLSQEDDNMKALKSEIAIKDERIASLREKLQEVSSEKQVLLEEKYILEKKINSFSKSLEEEEQQSNFQRQLMQNIYACSDELKRLVQLFSQHAKGEEPNMSLLLGVQAVPSNVNKLHADNIKMELDEVQKLRKDLLHIHSMFAEKYAEAMGDNLNCNNQ